MADERIKIFATEPEQRFIGLVLDRHVEAAMAQARQLPKGVNTTSPTGETALLFAVLNNDPAMVRALLDAGASPNGGSNRSPLHPAVRDASGRLVDMLLKAGADPNLTYNDEPPLLEAALVDARDNARKLLAAGAQIDRGNSIGMSPAMTAAAASHWIMVDMLIEHGASPWHTPPNGYTLAAYAANDRKPANSPEGQARDAIIAKFRSYGYPWPPPLPPEVRRLMEAGHWPPRMEPVR